MAVSFPHGWQRGAIGLFMTFLAVGCSEIQIPLGSTSLNSFYNEEQPTLSGNGRFLAFVSNRNGRRRILLYDLQEQRLSDLPGLNRSGSIAQSPSLSYTGRYIAYLADRNGKPAIAVYDRTTRHSQPLTLWYRGQVRNPNISPDGRYIVFESGRRGEWDIELIDRGPDIELDTPSSPPVNQF
ncbi:MAG TPA: biopolymer transporter Tol [Leptolyngbyaceae cyanobacterium]